MPRTGGHDGEAANRYVAATRPWELAKAEANGDASSYFDEVLGVLVDACHTLAREFQPFLPAASERIERALAASDPKLGRHLFPKAYEQKSAPFRRSRQRTWRPSSGSP